MNKTQLETQSSSLTHIWYFDKTSRCYNVPNAERWALKWKKYLIVGETTRSYILSNGVKAPKNPEKAPFKTFAYSDEQFNELVWHERHCSKITDDISRLARYDVELTRKLNALLEQHKNER